MKSRTSPDLIAELKPKEVFVFGSNLAGVHGAGAAKLALNRFKAEYGVGVGHQGNSYGIPTKDKKIQTMPVNEIQKYVTEFIEYAKANPSLTFLVTEIGCGLAGYRPKDIAPLFKEAVNILNIHLPERFWNILS